MGATTTTTAATCSTDNNDTAESLVPTAGPANKRGREIEKICEGFGIGKFAAFFSPLSKFAFPLHIYIHTYYIWIESIHP